MSDKPRALLITRNLPPLVGGMERLISHVVACLCETHDVAVIGPEGCGEHLPPSVHTIEIPVSPMRSFLLRSTQAAIRMARTYKPKLVFAGSGLTAPIALLTARLAGARCAVYLHGLDVEADHWAYRTIWRRSFRHFDRIIANSQFTQKLALEAGVADTNIGILNPGANMPDLIEKPTRRQKFRDQFGLGDAPLMLYVGRVTPRKGLSVFVRQILPDVLQHVADARLIVIGDEPKAALLQNARGEMQSTTEALADLGITHAVEFLGELSQDNPLLSDAYFAADAMVFPVQDRPGDNEGFGMVAIEAAAHDLPTVAFAVGGVPDAVANGVSGFLIEPNDHHRFAEAVVSLMQKRANNLTPKQYAEGFSWQHFGNQLNNLLP